MASKTGTSFDDLAKAFKQGNFKPLYFLYGDEGFFMDELQKLLIKHALQPHEHDFNLDVVFGPEANTASVLAQCAALPMMAERRVVIVRGFEKLGEKSPGKNQAFKEYAAHPNPAAVVMLLCNSKPNLSHNPYRALKKHAVWSEFKSLYDNQLPAWINQQLKTKGHKASAGAVQMLAGSIGVDLRGATAELDKLTTYVGGQETISEQDVVEAAGHSREHNVFELQKALGQGTFEQALAISDAILARASNRKGEAVMIIAMLISYFTKLWKLTSCRSKGLSEREMASQIGVNPFFMRDYLVALRRYKPRALHGTFEALLAADSELKGGSERDERLILTLALTQVRAAARQAYSSP